MRKVISGNVAAALAAKFCKPGVIAAYPITPQTPIVENLAAYVANGELEAEYIEVESEHSALSACIGAQATGVRTFTATSSQGLALMHEILFIASGLRLPIVMAVSTRALSAPINIWGDFSDTLAQRDSGWIQLYVKNAQEVFDTLIQAYVIAENKKVLLPVMVGLDGFVISHVHEVVELPTQREVDKFLPTYEPVYRLDAKDPITVGPIAFPDSYMEFKYQQEEAMRTAKKVIPLVNNSFKKRFGRKYGDGLVETYKLNDAKIALVAMGAVCGTIEELLERKDGVGLIRIKSFRPFPAKELANLCKNLDAVAVIDRAHSFGSKAPLCQEVTSCLARLNIKISSFVLGLGGRNITVKDIEFTIKNAASGKEFWVNVFGKNLVMK